MLYYEPVRIMFLHGYLQTGQKSLIEEKITDFRTGAQQHNLGPLPGLQIRQQNMFVILVLMRENIGYAKIVIFGIMIDTLLEQLTQIGIHFWTVIQKLIKQPQSLQG